MDPLGLNSETKIMATVHKLNCPICKGEVTRVNRQQIDRLINTLSLGLLKIRRYYCYSCTWQGLLNRFHK